MYYYVLDVLICTCFRRSLFFQTAMAVQRPVNRCPTSSPVVKCRTPAGRVVHYLNPGPQPNLSAKEERTLANHLVEAAQVGYGKTWTQVKAIVEKIDRRRQYYNLSSCQMSPWGCHVLLTLGWMPLTRLLLSSSTTCSKTPY